MHSTTSPIAHLDDFPVGSMRLAHADGTRICLARSADGVFAIDHACPHMGYGVTQGTLDGNLVTCAWHNWKFDIRTGECTVGDEDITTHPVQIDPDGGITVTVSRPDPAAQHDRLVASLRSAIVRHRVGQISREVVRLLAIGADPAALVWEAVAHGAPRGEFGWGHEIANAADCLAMVDLFDGDGRALPVVQAIAGISEAARDRPPHQLPAALAALPPNPASDFRSAVDAERLSEAQQLVVTAVALGAGPDELVRWFTAVVSDHLLDYGHAAIYTQKAFELLERVGWQHATDVLGHLVTFIVSGTREDTLPYMRPFMRTLAGLDLAALAAAPVDASWSGADDLARVLLAEDRRVVAPAAAAALAAGAGVDRLLDAVVSAVCTRMLRYDVDQERNLTDDFGWLDITHALTYAHATRWLHHHAPGPETIRLALFTAFLAHWSGRHEWHTSIGPEAADAAPTPSPTAIREHGAALQRRALTDLGGSFIVVAHDVKTSRAAALEAERLGSMRPLHAAARFMDSPRMQRFVASTVAQSIEFISGRAPRDT